MNYSTLSIAPIILALSLSNAHAADYDTAHTFAAGDVISADMMNELFNDLKKSKQSITAANMLGTWSCSTYTQVVFGNCSTMNGTDSLYNTKSGTITFAADGDGTHTYTTGSLNFLRCNNNAAPSSYPFVIKNNSLFTKMRDDSQPSNPNLVSIRLQRISETKFLMESHFHSSSKPLFMECDKTLTPPTNPTAFAVAMTNLSNVLTWTDNSSDESGFKVYKKTTVAGAWTLIDAGAGLTVSTNIVTYTDTVSAAGDNWYRVKASHVTNGDSIGSKVIKVTNSN